MITHKIRAYVVLIALRKFLNKQMKVLDIGCGSGIITNLIEKRFKCDILGVDVLDYADDINWQYNPVYFDFGSTEDVLKKHGKYLIKAKIKFENVSFQYENSDQSSLKDISIEILGGIAKGTHITISVLMQKEKTLCNVNSDVKLSLKTVILYPIIKKEYNSFLSGVFKKMSIDAK